MPSKTATPASRRLVLKSALASLTLPFMQSALPRAAWGQEVAPPKRLVTYFVGNGMYTTWFFPQNTGKGYDLPPVIEPIAPIQGRTMVISGLQNKADEVAPFQEHASAMGSTFTGVTIDARLSTAIAGTSVDQYYASAVGAYTPFSSVQVGVDNVSGGSSPFINQISYSNATTPLPPVTDPRESFDRLFGVADDTMSEEEQAIRKELRLSVLDSVLEQLDSVKKGLATIDRDKLDQYTDGVRDLENRLVLLDQIVCEAPDEPPSDPVFPMATDLHHDIMVTALKCDLTRTISFMQGPTLSETTYDWLPGVNSTLHTLSHNGWVTNNSRDDYVACNQWVLEQLVSFAQKLEGEVDTDGSDMLSNTLVAFASEFSESNRHDSFGPDVPVLLIGGEAAGLAAGEHRRYPDEALGNLWLAVLQQYCGLQQSTFGVNGRKPISLT